MDPNAIWPPNLSQVIPDATISLVVGALLALAIDRIQRSAADRAATDEAIRGWNRLQPRLRKYFSIPVALNSEMQSPVSDISADVADEPIRTWADATKLPVIAALVRIDTNVARAQALDQYLNILIGAVVHQSDARPALDEESGTAGWAESNVVRAVRQ